MNAQYLIRSACHFLRAQGKIPSARSVQAFLKTNTGSGARHDVVLLHLGEFLSQKTDNTWGTPREHPGNTSRAQNDHLGNTPGTPGDSRDLGNTWGTPREHPGNTSRAQNDHLGNTPGTPGEPLDQIVIKEINEVETDTLPSVASNTKSILSEKSAKPKAVKPTIAAVDFGNIEPLIGIFVANLAAQNKTGRVLDTRIAAMRAELHVAMLAHNHPSSFASGLAVANRAGIANVNYVRRVAETERDQAPKFALTAVAPIEYAGYVRTADAMWHPFRGTKRVVGWADGLPPGLLPERFSETPWSEAVAAKAQQTADEMAESA